MEKHKQSGKKYLLKVLEVKSESESIVNLKPIKSTTSGKSGHKPPKPAKRSTGSKYLLITDFNKFKVELNESLNTKFGEIDSRFSQIDSRFENLENTILSKFDEQSKFNQLILSKFDEQSKFNQEIFKAIKDLKN